LVAQVLQGYEKITYLEGVKLLQDAYMQSYGVFNLVQQAAMDAAAVSPDKKRPLASIAMHYAEDFTSTSTMQFVMKRYADAKVKDRYGLSLTEFLELPHEYTELIFEDCEEAMKVSITAQEKIMKSIEQNGQK
jgi:hypothetical protein